jgi:hypothetical protein
MEFIDVNEVGSVNCDGFPFALVIPVFGPRSGDIGEKLRLLSSHRLTQSPGASPSQA